MEKELCSRRWGWLADELCVLISYQENGRDLPEDKEVAAEKMNELLDVFEEAFGVTFTRAEKAVPSCSTPRD